MRLREGVLIATIVVAIVLIGEALVYVVPTYEADSEIVSDGSETVIRLDTNYSTQYTVMVTETDSNALERDLYIYRDSAYPSFIDDNYLGYWIDRMYAEFKVYGFSEYTVVDAEGLRDIMAGSISNGTATQVAVMVLSGVFPDTVYGGENTLVEEWLGDGGALYWTGGPLGAYVGHLSGDGEQLEIVDEDPGCRFFGISDSIAMSETQVIGVEPSSGRDIGLSMGIYYDDCSYGVSSSVPNSLFIGTTDGEYNSISISKYEGGSGVICVFGGSFPPNVKETAHSNILKVFFSGLSYDSKLVMLEHDLKDPGVIEFSLGENSGPSKVVFIYCGTMLGTYGQTFRLLEPEPRFFSVANDCCETNFSLRPGFFGGTT